MSRKKQREVIYLKPFDEAVSAGEVALYHASMARNTECAGAIDRSINDCYRGEYIYDLDSAVKSVIADFGAERTKFVMAVHLQRSSYDGRFSQTNKSWAATLNLPHISEFRYICISSHSTVLDGFTDHLREVTESQTKPKSGSYIIKKSVLFSNDRGFAFGESKSVVAPFVTWAFELYDDGERKYQHSKYFSTKSNARANYKSRIEAYKSNNNVEEVKE